MLHHDNIDTIIKVAGSVKLIIFSLGIWKAVELFFTILQQFAITIGFV